MGGVAVELSRAIKECKWLDITYKNKEGNITFFWCVIKDINHKTKK